MFASLRRAPLVRPLPLLLAAFTIASLTACGPKIRFSDSVDDAFDLRLTLRYDDQLHGPYVAGSSFQIYAYDATEDTDLSGWRLQSRDPDVLEILDQTIDRDDLDDSDKSEAKTDIISARVFAASEGTAIIEVYDDQDEFVRATELVVLQPDRVELRAAGPLFLDREDEVPSLVDATPKILSGGTATFLVEWFKGEQRLRGGGTLGLASSHAAIDDLWARQTLFDEDRDWATITVASGLESADSVVTPVVFSANGQTVESLDFSAVGPDAVAEITVHGESDQDANEHALLVVLAQAFDADDESIWGVGFDWDLDGASEPGEGDLFRYYFEEGAWTTLGAEYNGIRSEVEIQGTEGFVDSSNDIACFCTAGEDRPVRGIALGLLGLAAFGLVRRRRA